LAKKSYLSELFDLKATGTVPAQPTRNFDFTSAESLVEWSWHFGTRYSAISMIQVALGSPIPNPYNVVFDTPHAGVALMVIEPQNRELAFFRTSGQLAPLCSRPMLFGPMRIGFITAAESLALHRNSLALFVQTCLKVDHLDLLETAVKFTVRNSGPAEAEREVRNLIEQSVNRQTDVFAIPWI
jgi:hypothetical protein